MLNRLIALAAPWQALYGSSKILPSMVTTVHLVALLFGGGLAIAADRATLRVGRHGKADEAAQLAELRAVHRPVLVALMALFASGVLLTAADLETFINAPMFWVKLGLVALLLANGVILERTEARLRVLVSRSMVPAEPIARLWRRLRMSAVCSLALWTATLVAGALLVNIA
jgi:hypothetical protein